MAPEVALDWHPTKNGTLTPHDVPAGHDGIVWWRCGEGPDHEWRARACRRISENTGCPFCAGKKLSVTNRLSTVDPALAAEWHATKNGKLTPDDVVIGSSRRVWWQCPQGADHVWFASVTSRTRQGRIPVRSRAPAKTGCPGCLCRKRRQALARKRRRQVWLRALAPRGP